ncbi:hypothetical protein LOTGIDRAFT_233815 [Lottia gigantea]|uniref:KY-like immunoglobulin-like domain-containing protein n=1 Tax=Lottia gigantea TaxID=225164 RepID=V4BMT0_LOTGI|nr:hypothetical protein LOTGIDRAFT_233815 [Lottia gigantea]ESO90289.1 hypothetical protein LOTGIDRAFT_233815 [Lottia gigantea]
MSSQRPEIPEGYLGAQEALKDAGMTPSSHEKDEFVILENEVEIKFKVAAPVKATTNLIQVRTEKDINEYVFVQSDENSISFCVSVPESGWYKFQIFALAKSNESKSLPNVFNYLIHCKQALKSVYPCPKQFAIWKDGCRLYEPMVLNSNVRLRSVPFKVRIPKANAVAVVVDGEWTHLDKKGDGVFEGKMDLDKYRNKDVKLTLNGNFEDDETKFATLLEYKL